MNKILLIALHGVEWGEIKNDYANRLFDGIRNHMNFEENGLLEMYPYNWTKYTNPRQLEIYSKVEKGLGRQWFRKLKHTLGSDVSWGQRAKEGTPCFYTKFLNELIDLVEKYNGNGTKVVLFGHSQGSQLAYQFIFDYKRPIAHFFSAGSPISMNSGMFEDWGRVPPNLTAWTNFYNYFDGISSLLEGVHLSKQIAYFVKDVEVPKGYNPLRWTLAGSHTIYWESELVCKTITDQLKLILRSEIQDETDNTQKQERKEVVRSSGQEGKVQGYSVVQKVPINRIEKDSMRV